MWTSKTLIQFSDRLSFIVKNRRRKNKFYCQSRWVKPISLHCCWRPDAAAGQMWCSCWTDTLQPITVAVTGPDSNEFLPAALGFSLLCRSQKAAWTYLLKREVTRQLSVQQINKRNRDLITGHATLGSVALRFVVQTTFKLLPHEQAWTVLNLKWFGGGIQIIF